MKKILLLSTLLLCSISVFTQKNAVDQSRPENTLNAVFDAAKTGSLESLADLCEPGGSGDGDVKSVCGMLSASAEDQTSFADVFRDARIEGSITYKEAGGQEYCTIDFVFGPAGQQRTETMGLVKLKGKWYLASF